MMKKGHTTKQKKESVFSAKLKGIIAMGMVAVIALTSCEKIEPAPEPDPVDPEEAAASGVYVLCEGLFQMNNATLTFYNYLTGDIDNNYFLTQNGRGLGDTGNDLKAYGSKLYCVVNASETVEIMELKSAKSLKQISLSGKQPRRIAFADGYAYVCCFNGDVVKIDTATMEVTATAQAGSNPDGICVANGKLYVSNSGGLNYPNYGNTVSVFDLATFTRIKDIPVVITPTRMAADSQGDVYVVSNGNYGSVPTTFQRIDSQTDEVVQTFDFAVTNFAICDNLCYFYHYDYSTEQCSVKVMDVMTEQIVNEHFIADGTELHTPYGIAVNPENGDVYLTDAYQYTTNGDVYCFGSNGQKKFQFETGICPNNIIFLKAN